MQREFFFFDIIFYILVNEVKEFRKDINALRRWSTNAYKIDGKWSPLDFFSVNILYPNSFTLEPDSFSS